MFATIRDFRMRELGGPIIINLHSVVSQWIFDWEAYHYLWFDKDVVTFNLSTCGLYKPFLGPTPLWVSSEHLLMHGVTKFNFREFESKLLCSSFVHILPNLWKNAIHAWPSSTSSFPNQHLPPPTWLPIQSLALLLAHLLLQVSPHLLMRIWFLFIYIYSHNFLVLYRCPFLIIGHNYGHFLLSCLDYVPWC